jgi:hypothetical protein
MDISEYWATLLSIIVSLGLADLLINFHRLISERRRVVWDPLPLLWAIITLLFLFNYWWAVAANLDGSRNAQVAAHFVLLAVQPIVLFLMAASVLPRVMPADGRLDMQAAWANGRAVFLSLFALNQCVTWMTITVARGGIDWDFPAFVRTTTLVLLLIALLTKSRRLEWIVVLCVLSLVVWRLVTQAVR